MKNIIKEELNEERKKMSQMTRKEKLDYLWTYYKVHFFGLIVLLIVLFNIGNMIYRSGFHNELTVMVMNNYNGPTLFTPITEEFRGEMNLGKKQEISAFEEYLGSGDANMEHNYAVITKLAALISVQDLDVLIADKEIIERYEKEEILTPLEEYLTVQEIEALGERCYYTIGESQSRTLTAIRIEDTPFAEKMNLKEPSGYFVIIANSQHKELALKLLKRFLREE